MLFISNLIIIITANDKNNVLFIDNDYSTTFI